MTIPEMSSTVVAANADGETMAAQRAISQHEMRIQVSMAATQEPAVSSIAPSIAQQRLSRNRFISFAKRVVENSQKSLSKSEVGKTGQYGVFGSHAAN
jgi:hypothetical protein